MLNLGFRTTAAIVAGFLVVLAGGAAAYVFTQAGVDLKPDSSALARIAVQRFGGSVEAVRATGNGGRTITLLRSDGRLTPRDKVRPGERIVVAITVRRPGSVSWLLGSVRHERLVITAPTAKLTTPYVTVTADGKVRAGFDRAVSVFASGGNTHELVSPHSTVTIPTTYKAGATQVAAAVRPWEDLGKPVTVSWFPRSTQPVAVVTPAPGGQISPGTPIRMRFSGTIDSILGSHRPVATPAGGHWQKIDEHTLQYVPTGGTAAFGTKLTITLPRAVIVGGPQGGPLTSVRQLTFATPPGSLLRLQQLLAQAGYLPLDWAPSGTDVSKTEAAELKAAATAPKGAFTWRYPNTPKELQSQWTPGEANAITRGAVMKFQSLHALTVDALAGPGVWNALIKDAIHGTRLKEGYSYVYVHRDLPQKLTLWHAGVTIITSPGNTGVPEAPTQLGTFPVFEHVPVTTMSGTNPDGSHYNDPGIKWVSYFNGGDALHTFNRASFGTPQSLGCVELPEATAKRVYPFTPIGTLVTIEH